MKQYVQDPGNRQIKGNDFIAIQDIGLLTESFLAQFGNYIIYGCIVNGNAISSGVVMLNGKACIFEGSPNITLPLYVKYNVATENVPYGTGTGTGRGYEIYQAIQAAETDPDAFRLDNAPRFADVFTPRKALTASDADTLDGKHANQLATNLSPETDVQLQYDRDTNTMHVRANGSAVPVADARTVGGKFATDFALAGFGSAGESCKKISDQNLYDHVAVNAKLMGARVANAPSAAWFYFEVDVYSSNTCYVLAKAFYTNDIFDNKCNDGVWRGWRNIADGGAASSLATARSLWGRAFNGTGNVSGDMANVGNIDMNGRINGVTNIELYAPTPYIDFHFNSSQDDYTSRIVEQAAGDLATNAKLTAAAFYEVSDERLKNIKADFEPSLADILALPLFYYSLKDKPDTSQLGTSAQTVKEHFPELVNEANGLLSVDYSKLSVVALKGISLLYKKMQQLEQRIKTFENR